MSDVSIHIEWSWISYQEYSFYLVHSKKSLKSPAHGCLEGNCSSQGDLAVVEWLIVVVE